MCARDGSEYSFSKTNITTGTVNDTVLSLPTNNFVMSNTAGFPQVPSTKQDVNTNPNAPLVMNAPAVAYPQPGYPQPTYNPQSQPFVYGLC